MFEKQIAVNKVDIYSKVNLSNESPLSPPVTTISLKKNKLNVKSAHFLGYKAGLTNHISAVTNFNPSLSEKLSLAWLDGWLDGVEATEKQCLETYEDLEISNGSQL